MAKRNTKAWNAVFSLGRGLGWAAFITVLACLCDIFHHVHMHRACATTTWDYLRLGWESFSPTVLLTLGCVLSSHLLGDYIALSKEMRPTMPEVLWVFALFMIDTLLCIFHLIAPTPEQGLPQTLAGLFLAVTFVVVFIGRSMVFGRHHATSAVAIEKPKRRATTKPK